jgi:preprotein translocase subunit YajC
MIPTLFLLIQQAAAPTGAPAGAPAGGAAPTNAGPLGCAGGQGTQMLFPMALIFVVFYFMLIRPQQKKEKERQSWLTSLKKGDEVVTTGGVIGKISGIQDNVIVLEVQEKVRMRFLRSHIAGKAPGAPGPGPSAEPEKK